MFVTFFLTIVRKLFLFRNYLYARYLLRCLVYLVPYSICGLLVFYSGTCISVIYLWNSGFLSVIFVFNFLYLFIYYDILIFYL